MYATPLYRTTTEKSIEQCLNEIKTRLYNYELSIKKSEFTKNSENKIDLKLTPTHSKQPNKSPIWNIAAENISKHLSLLSHNNKTEIQLLSYTPEIISRLIEDDDFPDILTQSYRRVINLIDDVCLDK